MQRSTFLLAASFALAALSGCTFLVDFVTKDAGEDPCDGGECADDAAVPDELPDVEVDTAEPVLCPAPCQGRASGWYCGTNGLHCDAGVNNLVHCKADAIATVTACAHCARLPSNTPDTCDPCVGMKDGKYCGKQFPGIVTHTAGADNNDIYLFVCVNGETSSASVQCTSDCTGTGPSASCK